MIKVVLAAQNPEKVTRLINIRLSLEKKYNVQTLEPLTKIRKLGKVPSAIFRYCTYAFQEYFVGCNVMHLFSSPDFIHILSLVKDVQICYDYRSNYSEKLKSQHPKFAVHARSIEKKLFNKAKVVLTVNDILAERITTITNSPIYIVPNFPKKSFKPSRKIDVVKKELRIDTPIALFVGNISSTYDFDLIFRSAIELKGVTFIIIGSGKPLRILKENSPDNVRFLGLKSNNIIADYINASDVCLAPIRSYSSNIVSNDQDVWKVGEYAALQKPIVATNLAPSNQYLLARSKSDFVELIKKALRNDLDLPIPKFWEDYSEPALFEAYNKII